MKFPKIHSQIYWIWSILLFYGAFNNRLAYGNQLKPQATSLIRNATVLIQAEGLDPGSGVILRKERDKYYILTAAHVLGRLICTDPDNVEEDQIEIMTSDGIWHELAPNSVKCPPIVPIGDKLCSSAFSQSSPWPIDLAIISFQSEKNYNVAKKHDAIRRNGVHIFAAGFPQDQESDPPKIVIYRSEGPAEIPPKSPNDTCKGYGIRYIMPTKVGMSGGGIWSEKGKLIGIHGWREQTRDKNIYSKGSASAGIPLDYWKREKDPYEMKFSKLISNSSTTQKSKKVDVQGLISRSRALVNLSLTQDRETFLMQVDDIISTLLKAEQADLQQPLIPALISQIYIRQFQETDSKDFELLKLAFAKINKSIKLSEKWDKGFDGKFNLIRAYIFYEFGKYDKAIIDVNRRLKAVPNDVAALKEKARYSVAANDLNMAYKTLTSARKLQPDDFSIPLDIAYVFLKTQNSAYAERTCNLLSQTQTAIKVKLKSTRGALRRDLKDLLQRANTYLDFSKCRP